MEARGHLVSLHQGSCRLLRCRLAAEEVEAGGHLVSLLQDSPQRGQLWAREHLDRPHLCSCRLPPEEVEERVHLVSLNMYIRVRMLVI